MFFNAPRSSPWPPPVKNHVIGSGTHSGFSYRSSGREKNRPQHGVEDLDECWAATILAADFGIREFDAAPGYDLSPAKSSYDDMLRE